MLDHSLEKDLTSHELIRDFNRLQIIIARACSAFFCSLARLGKLKESQLMRPDPAPQYFWHSFAIYESVRYLRWVMTNMRFSQVEVFNFRLRIMVCLKLLSANFSVFEVNY